eukprot:CAMPEP_0197718970 /NCGR_PEP_ID=MMETSP1434-20131217/2908_1 /TAXON_ID=265543 /ORGANISM="Minutocellus polymorphus, Strain CCMP3303" /LENGTH=190 /DNA_ID=CAMNT_0043303665 /DNA_START=442 /DNA_END=1010 /DNA_ORIENTATION=+
MYNQAFSMNLPGPVVDLSSITDYTRDAPMEEFKAVLDSPVPVVVSSWNDVNNGAVEAATAAGVAGQSTLVDLGGGLRQTVSLSQHNIDVHMDKYEDEDDDEVSAAGACCDAYASFMPIYEEIVKAANSHPLAKEKAAEFLKKARDAVVQGAHEALGGMMKGPGDNNSSGMASSNVPGMDKSSQSNRKRPA